MKTPLPTKGHIALPITALQGIANYQGPPKTEQDFEAAIAAGAAGVPLLDDTDSTISPAIPASAPRLRSPR